MEVDLNQVISTLIAGGAIWAGIRIEIKYLWRDIERHDQRISALESRNQ